MAADVSRVPFRIDPDGLSSIDDVLEVMELRLAVEVEAAARAAERITPRRLASIDRVLRAFEDATRQGEAAVNEDFAFHLAIAEASGNSRFAEILEFLGRHVIPRMIRDHAFFAYDVSENVVPGLQPHEERAYWRDVGTLPAYIAAHRDLAILPRHVHAPADAVHDVHVAAVVDREVRREAHLVVQRDAALDGARRVDDQHAPARDVEDEHAPVGSEREAAHLDRPERVAPRLEPAGELARRADPRDAARPAVEDQDLLP